MNYIMMSITLRTIYNKFITDIKITPAKLRKVYLTEQHFRVDTESTKNAHCVVGMRDIFLNEKKKSRGPLT